MGPKGLRHTQVISVGSSFLFTIRHIQINGALVFH